MPIETKLNTAHINLTTTGSTSKYCAIPPQTPPNTRSFLLRYKRLIGLAIDNTGNRTDFIKFFGFGMANNKNRQ